MPITVKKKIKTSLQIILFATDEFERAVAVDNF